LLLIGQIAPYAIGFDRPVELEVDHLPDRAIQHRVYTKMLGDLLNTRLNVLTKGIYRTLAAELRFVHGPQESCGDPA
jgi:hypothetical protein